MKAIYLFSLLCLLIACNEKKSEESAQPNIIFIMADDLGYGELGAYGQAEIETPNLDALAADGMKFTQFYSGAPVCAPARAILLSGLHAGHSFVRGNDEWGSRGDVWSHKAMLADSSLEGQYPMPSETVMIPELLKDVGYKTGMVGKWGLGAPHTESVPNKQGFDYFFGYNCQRIAHTLTPTHLWENDQKYHLRNDTLPPGSGLTKGADPNDPDSYKKYNKKDYAPTVSFEKLMNFVRDAGDDPFFLYWATPIPHLPLQAPQNWVDHYVQKFGDEEPYYFYEGEKGSYFPVRNPRATYAAMVSYLDENVGKLVSYLKEEGLYENTIIMFTSDNGPSYTGGTDSEFFNSARPFSSEYGRGKGFVYEGGIRVPLVASWPARITPGSNTDHISVFYDIMPTLCEIAGVPAASKTDGLSFLSTLTGEGEQEVRDHHYWEFSGYQGQIAVRKGDWKMIWKDIKKGNQQVEVYNLAKDNTESEDVAEQHPEMVEEFFRIVKEEHQQAETERFRMEAVEAL